MPSIGYRLSCIRINAPEWYEREDWQNFILGVDAHAPATWHSGPFFGECSDVFFTYDSGEGSDKDAIPEDIWKQICEICEAEQVRYAIIWVTNLEE